MKTLSIRNMYASTFAAAAGGLLLALVCAGCQPAPGTRSEPAGSMSVLIDPATGCEYLNYLTHRGCRKEGRVSP